MMLYGAKRLYCLINTYKFKMKSVKIVSLTTLFVISIRLVEPILSRKLTFLQPFSHCAPGVYNQLPYDQRTLDDLSTFKKKRKTYFFSKRHMIL